LRLGCRQLFVERLLRLRLRLVVAFPGHVLQTGLLVRRKDRGHDLIGVPLQRGVHDAGFVDVRPGILLGVGFLLAGEASLVVDRLVYGRHGGFLEVAAELAGRAVFAQECQRLRAGLLGRVVEERLGDRRRLDIPFLRDLLLANLFGRRLGRGRRAAPGAGAGRTLGRPSVGRIVALLPLQDRANRPIADLLLQTYVLADRVAAG